VAAPTAKQLRRATEYLDAFYDDLLQSCTDREQVVEVQERRAKDHAELADYILQLTIGDYARPR
jgi:hypothetical protein